jgi:hypothetical protein
MRARHRHFNPKAAGALFALDARFLTGLSNNDPVSTWTNRTGINDVTASSTARPLFKSNSVNNNPALEFDGVNDRLVSGNVTFFADFILVAVVRLTRSPNYSSINTLATKSDHTSTNNNRPGFYAYLTNNFATTTNNFVSTEAWTGNTNSPQTIVNGLSVSPTGALTVGTAAIVSNNFSNINTGSASPLHIGAEVRTGSRFGQMDLASLAYVSGSTASLRRRLEHASAFSFKIACN